MSALPTVTQFADWLAAARDTASTTFTQAAAASNLIVAYARAAARTEGLDEHSACLAALEAVRQAQGEAVAYGVAAVQGIDIDDLLEQEREDAEQRQREADFEDCVPWGRDS